MAPSATSAWTSARISPGGGRVPCRAGTARCRTCRCCCSPRRWRPSRSRWNRAGWAAWRGTPRGTRGFPVGPRGCGGRAPAARAAQPTLWVPKTTSTQGAFLRMVSRSFWARQPPTAICMPGRRSLTGASRPRLPYSLLSAFSRTAQVLKTTTSAAPSGARVRSGPVRRPRAGRTGARNRGRSSGSRRCGPRRCARRSPGRWRGFRSQGSPIKGTEPTGPLPRRYPCSLSHSSRMTPIASDDE